MTDASEEELRSLVDRAQEGDANSCNLLFEKYLSPMMSRVRRRMPYRLRVKMDSSDLVQTSLREAIQSLDRFEWRGGGSFYQWLCRITDHKMIRKLRYFGALRRDAKREISMDQPGTASENQPEPESKGTSPDDLIMTQEQGQVLRREIEQLSDAHHRVLSLSLEGLTDQEVADKMGISADAAWRLRMAAVRKLTIRLKQVFDE